MLYNIELIEEVLSNIQKLQMVQIEGKVEAKQPKETRKVKLK